MNNHDHDLEKRESNLKAMAEAYNQNPEREWFRLVKEPYNNLEFQTTLWFIRQYYPKSGLILDAGGGPGRYAIELAKMGYGVTLLDISAGNIEFAKEKIKQEATNIQSRITECLVGDVRNLSRFSNNHFDAILCLDPLSNLFAEEDRMQTVRELYRVAKPQAIVFIGGRGFLGVLRTLLYKVPDELLSTSLDDLKKTGNIKAGPNICHFFHAEELKALAESNGFETITMAGCIGLSMGLQTAVNQLATAPEKWAKWLEIEIKTATDPAIVDTSEHMLYIGRKPGK